MGLEDGGPFDIEALLVRHPIDLIRIADEDGGEEGSGQQTGRSLQDAGVLTLGEYNLLGVLLQLLDH